MRGCVNRQSEVSYVGTTNNKQQTNKQTNKQNKQTQIRASEVSVSPGNMMPSAGRRDEQCHEHVKAALTRRRQ
jgi:hypothetical protein